MNKIILFLLLLSASAIQAREYVDSQIDYVPQKDNSEGVLALYAWNNYWIDMWKQSLKQQCASDLLNKNYSKKEYFEKQLVKINKDLKACYQESSGKELTSQQVQKYEAELIGDFGMFTKQFLSNYGNNYPLTYRELKSCIETVRMIEMTNQQVMKITNYPNKGWCKKMTE